MAGIRKWTATLFPGTGREECDFFYSLLLINDIYYIKIMITLVSSSHIYEYKSFVILQPQDESDLREALGTLREHLSLPQKDSQLLFSSSDSSLNQ